MSLQLKPYQEYKESGVPWLGKVPKRWEMVPGLAVLKKRKIRNEGMKETTVLSLSYGRIVVKPKSRLHGLVPESFETYQIVETGNIIIRPTDLQNDWNSLRVGIAKDRGIITSAYLCLETTNNLVDAYGYWLLLAYDLMKIFYGMGSGLRQNLDFQDLRWMPVIRPSLTEQKQIVEFLTNFDRHIKRLIRAKHRLIERLNEQKQAIIHQAVTRGLNPNVRLKPSGIEWLGAVPEHWEVRKIKALLDIRDGTHDTPPYVEPGVSTFALVTTKFLGEGRIFLEDAPHISEADYSKIARRSYVSKFDVIMPMIGTVGNPVVVETDLQFAIKNIALFRTAASRRMLPEYLCFVLKSNAIARQMADLTRGGVQDFVGLNTLRNLILAVPSPQEQRTILRQLRKATANITDAINAASIEVKFINEYRTRLISDVVTGKLDVRGLNLDEAIYETDLLEDLEENEAEIDSDQEIDEMEGLDE